MELPVAADLGLGCLVVVAAEVGLGHLVVVAADLDIGRLVVAAADLGPGRLVIVALSFPPSLLLPLVCPGTLPRSVPSSPGPTSSLASASGPSRLLSRRLFVKLGKLLLSPPRLNVATRVFDVVFTTLIFLFRPFFIHQHLPAARACCLFSSVIRPYRLSGSFRAMFWIYIPLSPSSSP